MDDRFSDVVTPSHEFLNTGFLRPFDGPSILRCLSGPSPCPVEIELKYFATIEGVQRFLDLDNHPSLTVTQRYFPAELREIAGVCAVCAGLECDLAADFKFTQVRLRQIDEGGVCRHYLEAKGRRPGSPEYERGEFSWPISPQMHARLGKSASAGRIHKRRYLAAGLVQLDSGIEMPVTAEVDCLISAGGRRSHVPLYERWGWATIDVEARGAEQIEALRRGQHSLSLLSGAIELSNANRGWKRALSSQRLARHGVDGCAAETIAELRRICAAAAGR